MRGGDDRRPPSCEVRVGFEIHRVLWLRCSGAEVTAKLGNKFTAVAGVVLEVGKCHK